MRSQKNHKIQLFLNLIKNLHFVLLHIWPRRGFSFRGLTRSQKAFFSRSFRRLSGCYPQKRKRLKSYTKIVPERMVLFWGWHHLAHLWRTNLFLDTQSIPKVLQKWPQGCKSDPKILRKLPQGRKMDSYKNAKVVQVHEKMSAARYQARRAARSAYNKIVNRKGKV